MSKSEYAQAGVDYEKIGPFKRAMQQVAQQTLAFPNRRGVHVSDKVNAHGAVYWYEGNQKHFWCKTQEGLGNLNWVAEWMYQHTGTSYYDVAARAAALIIAIDVIAQGAMPVIWTDEVAAGDSERYEGDVILGVPSSGLHANGVSLVIKRALELPDQFLTKLSNGKTLGEEILTPIPSYVQLIEAILEKEILPIHTIVPGTGGGVAKLASDKRPLTYRIHSWVEVPLLFRFMQELGVTLDDCLTTFNWGMGLYLIVPRYAVEEIIKVGIKAGYPIQEIGVVEQGERKVVFGPENDLILRPVDG